MPDNEVDSEVEVPNETDSTETSPAAGEQAAEDVTPLGTLTPEQKRLADTEAAIKERQREFHELSNKVAELKGQLDERLKQTATTQVQKDWLDDEQIQAQLRDDPSKVPELMKKLRAELIGSVVNTLNARDQYFMEELNKTNPEVVALRDKINELRKDEDYKGFTDEQLVVVAKKANPKASYRGAPGGSRVPAATDDIRKSSLFKRIYGSENQV